jgi:hypothetical protein
VGQIGQGGRGHRDLSGQLKVLENFEVYGESYKRAVIHVNLQSESPNARVVVQKSLRHLNVRWILRMRLERVKTLIEGDRS